MRYNFFELHFFFFSLAHICKCWQYFTPMGEVDMLSSPLGKERYHSEYIYGDCSNPDLVFYVHIHKDHMEVLGKLIIREWILIKRIPTCIKLTAMSFREDLFRATGYNFQICVPRITYAHSRYRWKYFYLEWYIPRDYSGGMDWDIVMFGPKDLAWG